MPCERDLDQVDAGDAPAQHEQLALNSCHKAGLQLL
jgi:hypothetical protein